MCLICKEGFLLGVLLLRMLTQWVEKACEVQGALAGWWVLGIAYSSEAVA